MVELSMFTWKVQPLVAPQGSWQDLTTDIEYTAALVDQLRQIEFAPVRAILDKNKVCSSVQILGMCSQANYVTRRSSVSSTQRRTSVLVWKSGLSPISTPSHARQLLLLFFSRRQLSRILDASSAPATSLVALPQYAVSQSAGVVLELAPTAIILDRAGHAASGLVNFSKFFSGAV